MQRFTLVAPPRAAAGAETIAGTASVVGAELLTSAAGVSAARGGMTLAELECACDLCAGQVARALEPLGQAAATVAHNSASEAEIESMRGKFMGKA